MDSKFLQRLAAAVSGLTYPSESDEPFEIFTRPAAGTARFAVQANAKSTAISEQSVATFFDELMDDPQSDRFKGLRDLLTANLEGVCVFRVHRGSELDVYVIGRASTGEWIGVKTMSVET
jgi:hypothetical protein